MKAGKDSWRRISTVSGFWHVKEVNIIECYFNMLSANLVDPFSPDPG